jgi:hypothetical protein
MTRRSSAMAKSTACVAKVTPSRGRRQSATVSQNLATMNCRDSGICGQEKRAVAAPANNAAVATPFIRKVPPPLPMAARVVTIGRDVAALRGENAELRRLLEILGLEMVELRAALGSIGRMASRVEIEFSRHADSARPLRKRLVEVGEIFSDEELDAGLASSKRLQQTGS